MISSAADDSEDEDGLEPISTHDSVQLDMSAIMYSAR